MGRDRCLQRRIGWRFQFCRGMGAAFARLRSGLGGRGIRCGVICAAEMSRPAASRRGSERRSSIRSRTIFASGFARAGCHPDGGFVPGSPARLAGGEPRPEADRARLAAAPPPDQCAFELAGQLCVGLGDDPLEAEMRCSSHARLSRAAMSSSARITRRDSAPSHRTLLRLLAACRRESVRI